jgi:glycosyltransferase involved in cell wall biosynthesis
MQKSKEKILHIITRLDKGGSAENTIYTVARLGSDRAVLLSGKTNDPDGRIADEIRKNNVKLIVVPELEREINIVKDIKAFFKIYRHIKKDRYEIVHTHSSKAGILGRWAAWLAGVKIIIHTPHGHVFYGYFGAMKSRLFVILEKITALITNRIITLTEKGTEEHLRFKIASAAKFVTIPSGIRMSSDYENCPLLDMKKELGISTDAIVVGTVSRLDPVKGNKYLIETINEIKKRKYQKWNKMKFIIVGGGSEEEKLKNMAIEYGVYDKIIFTGMREDAEAIISIMDIFVLFSLMEGMGKVLLKAMLYGKPVVSTDVGGIPEIINEGINGYLVPSGDYVSAANSIIKLVSDEKLRKQMGLTGHGLVNKEENGLRKYSFEGMIAKIERLYDSERHVCHI